MFLLVSCCLSASILLLSEWSSSEFEDYRWELESWHWHLCRPFGPFPFFFTHTASWTMISRAYIYIVWKNTSCLLFILPSHIQLHISYFRKKKYGRGIIKKKQETWFHTAWQSISHQLHRVWIDTHILPSFFAMGGCLFSFSKAADELPSK